jgi:hypothetical protein
MNVNVRLLSIAAVAGTVAVLVLFLVVALLKGGAGATTSPSVVTIIGFIATLVSLLASLVTQTAIALKVDDVHAKVDTVEQRLNGGSPPP